MQVAEKDYTVELEAQCEQCGSDKLTVIGRLRYFEFFVIPLFPITSTFRKLCGTCKRNTIIDYPKHNPIPKSYYLSRFVGLLLIPIFLLLYNLVQQEQRQLELDILAKPQPFDFYIIDLKKLNLDVTHKFSYGIAKVIAINNESIEIKLSNYSYQTEQSLIKDIRSDTLLINDYFSTKVHRLAKSDLLKYETDNAIVTALRPENLVLFGGLVVTPKEINGR